MKYEINTKFNKSVWVGIFFVFLLVMGCGTPEEKKMAFFNKGNTLFEAGDYVKARLEFKNSIQIDPKFSKAYYRLGMTELKLGNAKAAFGQLSKAVKYEPGLIEARIALGKIFIASRAFDRAGAQADEILKIDPENIDAKLIKASVYHFEKKYDAEGAILKEIDATGNRPEAFYMLQASHAKATGNSRAAGDALKKGAEAYPDSLNMTMALAKYYGQEGDAKAFEACLKKAVGLSPGKVDLRMNLAWLYLKTERSPEAREILDKIIESDPENQKNILAVAVMLIRGGELDQGIDVVKKGIETHPLNYDYISLLSEIYLKQKEVKKAEDLLLDFLAMDDELALPDRVKAKVNLSKLLLLQKKVSDAEALVDQVLEDDPKNIDAHYLKGRLSLVRGDGAEAALRFRAVIDEHPEYLEGYIGLANAHALNKDYDLALDVLKSALEKSPNSAKVLKTMVQVNVLKKDDKAAEENLKQIVSLDPYNLGSIAGLGDFYLSMNRYDEAMAQYELLKKHKTKGALGYLKTARLLTKQNQIEKAIDELESGYEKAKKSSVFITSLGQLYLRQGEKEKAIEKFREAVAVDPGNQMVWLTLGNIYESSREYEKAMDLYREFLKHHPDSWSAANNLAFLLSEKGGSKDSLEQAMDFAQKADSLNPDSPLVQDTLAWIYYKNGDFLKAEELIKQAIEKMPDNTTICYHLGAISHDLGKSREAGKNLKKALSANTDFLGRMHASALYEQYYK